MSAIYVLFIINRGFFSLLKSTAQNLDHIIFNFSRSQIRDIEGVKILLSTMANTDVSSANHLMLFNMPSLISLIYQKPKVTQKITTLCKNINVSSHEGTAPNLRIIIDP